MSDRLNIHTGAPWESIVGYCRAVRVGPHVAVTGTAAVSENGEGRNRCGLGFGRLPRPGFSSTDQGNPDVST